MRISFLKEDALLMPLPLFVSAIMLLFPALLLPLQAEAAPDSPEIPSLEGTQEEVESRVRTFDKLMMIQVRRLEDTAGKEGQPDNRPGTEEARSHAAACLSAIQAAYEEALLRFPDSAVLHNFYAEFLYDFQGKTDDAQKHWRQAVALNPRLGRALNNLGMLYCHVGQYGQGLEYLWQSLKEEPDNPDFLFNTVQVYLIHPESVMSTRKITQRKIYEEAMAMSERAVKNAPRAFDILQDYALNFYLAEKFDAKPDWKKAAKAWQEARKQAKTKDELFNTWLNEGRVHIRQHKTSAARTCLEEARALRPESAVLKALFENLEDAH